MPDGGSRTVTCYGKKKSQNKGLTKILNHLYPQVYPNKTATFTRGTAVFYQRSYCRRLRCYLVMCAPLPRGDKGCRQHQCTPIPPRAPSPTQECLSRPTHCIEVHRQGFFSALRWEKEGVRERAYIWLTDQDKRNEMSPEGRDSVWRESPPHVYRSKSGLGTVCWGHSYPLR